MKPWVAFLTLIRPFWHKALLVFALILLASMLNLAVPWSVKIIIDEVFIRRTAPLLSFICLALIAVLAAKALCTYWQEYLVYQIGESVIRALRNTIYGHLQKLSVSYIESAPGGSVIASVMADADSIRNFLFAGIFDFICSSCIVACVLVMMVIINWRLALIAGLYLPMLAVSFVKAGPLLKSRHAHIRQLYAELTTRLQDFLSGVRVIAGFGREEYEAKLFDQTQERAVRAALSGHRLAVLLWTGSEFMSSLGLVALLWFGGRYVFLERISAGELIAFYTYAGMVLFPLVRMSVINASYQEAAAAHARIQAILEQKPRINSLAHARRIRRMNAEVCVRNVSFSYTGVKNVLHGVNLCVPAGRSLALVGRSGSGKTTLINLLLRFYDPCAGTIFIDGHDLRGLDLGHYRSQLGIVMQDDFFFNATVRENLCYAAEQVCEKRIMEVSERARAHEFVMRLPRQYDTVIGERGVLLSGGQRQRLSIARALLRDPALLILDEATSCVDSQTERLIIEQAYRDLVKGRTTIIIAHRLSSIGFADRIAVMDRGRIIEEGTHSQLTGGLSRYSRMWQEQMRPAAQNICF